jgi:putative FmdB family regulatory protein
MPIYAYRCTACGHAKDVLQKMSDPVLTDCPACGAQAFTKQVTAAGFQLKGSGWYVTDFKNGAAKPAAAPADGAKPDAAPAADAAKAEPGAAPEATTTSTAKSDAAASPKTATPAAPVAAPAAAPAPSSK